MATTLPTRTPVSVAHEPNGPSLFLYRRDGSPETLAMFAQSYTAVRAKVPTRVLAIVRVLAWVRRTETRAS